MIRLVTTYIVDGFCRFLLCLVVFKVYCVFEFVVLDTCRQFLCMFDIDDFECFVIFECLQLGVVLVCVLVCEFVYCFSFGLLLFQLDVAWGLFLISCCLLLNWFWVLCCAGVYLFTPCLIAVVNGFDLI